jgi:predicted nuclease of predicted toxin-antitoxin system
MRRKTQPSFCTGGWKVLVFLDENVPHSVAAVFEQHGHQVMLHQDFLAAGAADPIVAAAAQNVGAILVSIDKDFKQIMPRVPTSGPIKFPSLSLIHIRCSEPIAAARIGIAMSFIEFELALATAHPSDPRMIVHVGKDQLRSQR